VKVRDIPATAADSYLRLLRLPLDAAIDRLPGNGTGAAPTARLVVDRADASLRALLASVLRDRALREDALRRRTAGEKRAQALELRDAAERKTEQADARLEQREEQAERQREQAKQRAKNQREQAKRRRDGRTSTAAQTERRRKQASRKSTERAEEAVAERATRERLSALEAKTDALNAKEQALSAGEEAGRLRDVASRTKADRKNGSS
jgi:hypothetical protein